MSEGTQLLPLENRELREDAPLEMDAESSGGDSYPSTGGAGCPNGEKLKLFMLM